MTLKLGRKARYVYFYIFLLFWPYFIVDNLLIMHIFKKSSNNTKEKGDQRKNSGCNVIFGGMSISA